MHRVYDIMESGNHGEWSKARQLPTVSQSLPSEL